MPGNLASVDEYVVRPLDERGDNGLPLESDRDREPGDQRQLRQRYAGRRQKHHGEEQIRRRLVLPAPTGAAAAVRLVLRQGNGAMRVVAVPLSTSCVEPISLK